MAGFFVSRRGAGVAIHFDENELCRIIGLLDDVKTGDAGLANAAAGILDRGLFEGADTFGFHARVNMHSNHNFLPVVADTLPPRAGKVNHFAAGFSPNFRASQASGASFLAVG